MKSIILSVVATASLIFSGASMAAGMPSVAKSKCTMCHAVDKQVIGPSFMAISKKYKGDPDAVAKMEANIIKGGAFGWNLTNMPPRGMGASDAQIKVMAEYIAGLAK